jgi:glycerol-3-phosphate O-acyltransferase
MSHATRDPVSARPSDSTHPGATAPVVLAVAQTPVEHELIARWVAAEHPGAEIIGVDEPVLAERLGERDDPQLLPVRVAWLPRERGGARTARVSDLLLLTNPRRPRPSAQERIARREPDRCHLIAGEAALTSELARAWEDESGRSGGPAGFAAFVGRRAHLALERAERAIVGDRYKVPRLVADQITDSAHFRERVHKLAVELGEPEEVVVAHARDCLEEVAAVQSRLALDIFNTVFAPMHARAWTVDVDEESLERLRRLNQAHPLVFLPSHRSYSDPLVLGRVLQRNDFPPNHVLGGNNMSFWPIGPLAKRAGIVFIRRSFGDDRVYKLAVREYFAYLVAKRFNLEWYIEGGRTRTGKLRPPRYGLLAYLVRALLDDRAEDVILVPTSIVYDQLREVGLMAAEQAGAKKSAEGVRWLAGYMRAQRSDAGTAQVRFGEPISLREALARAGEENQLEKVAFEICDGINGATPISATSLVTLALLGVRDRALTFAHVRAVLAPLLGYVERRSLPGRLDVLRSDEGIRQVLDRLVAEKVVTLYDGGLEPVWSIEPGQHVVAAFYRNGAVHWFVNRAIIELCLLHLADLDSAGEDLLEAGFNEAMRIRDLLKFEFFFAGREEFRAQLREELEVVDHEWQDHTRTPDDAAAMLARSGSLFVHRVLRSFFDAQLVVAERLAARNPATNVDGDELLDECVGVGRQMLLQGRLHGPESVSRELFASALKLAENRGLLGPGGGELKAARDAFAVELADVISRIDRIAELDALVLEKVLDEPR